jgi:hypothetical protein
VNHRYVGLVRVSTERQGESRLGPEAGLKDLRDYVAAHGGQLVEVLEEVESGTHDDLVDRPTLLRALTLCKRHRAVLLIPKNLAMISPGSQDEASKPGAALNAAIRKGQPIRFVADRRRRSRSACTPSRCTHPSQGGNNPLTFPQRPRHRWQTRSAHHRRGGHASQWSPYGCARHPSRRRNRHD